MPTLGRLLIKQTLDSSGIDKGVKQSERSLGRYRRSVNNTSGGITKSFGGIAASFSSAFGLGSLGLLVGAGAALNDARKTVVSFEQSIADLASITGKSIQDMKGLSDAAQEIGAVSAFSASEVVSLQTSLAKLGFNEREIIASTKAIGDFSIAVGTDAASAAELAGSVLRSFGKDASEAEAVVSTLAVATTKSALDFAKLDVSLSKVGAVARSQGVSLERTTALLGILSNNGIEASTAGRSLRNIFLLLSKEGLTFNQAMNRINNSTDKAKTALELFGSENAVTAITLARSGAAVDELEASITNVDGALKEMTDKRLDTVKGRTILLTSAWEGLVLAIDTGSSSISTASKELLELGTNLINTSTAAVKGDISFGTYFKKIAGLLSGTTGGFAVAASVDATVSKIQELEGELKQLGAEELKGKISDVTRELSSLYSLTGTTSSNSRIQELKKDIEETRKEILKFEKLNVDVDSIKNYAKGAKLKGLREDLSKYNEELEKLEANTSDQKAINFVNKLLEDSKKLSGATSAVSELEKEINGLSYSEIAAQRKFFVDELTREYTDKGVENANEAAKEFIKTQLTLKKEVGDTKIELTGFAAFMDDKFKASLKTTELKEFEDRLTGISNAALNTATQLAGFSPVGIVDALNYFDRFSAAVPPAKIDSEFSLEVNTTSLDSIQASIESIPNSKLLELGINTEAVRNAISLVQSISEEDIRSTFYLDVNNDGLDSVITQISNLPDFKLLELGVNKEQLDNAISIVNTIPEEKLITALVTEPDLIPLLEVLKKIPEVENIDIELTLQTESIEKIRQTIANLSKAEKAPLQIQTLTQQRQQEAITRESAPLATNQGDPLNAISPEIKASLDEAALAYVTLQDQASKAESALASIGLTMNAQGNAVVSLSNALAIGAQAFAGFAEDGIKSVGELANAVLKAGLAIVKSLIREGIAAAVANALKSSSFLGLAAIPIAASAGAAAAALFESIIPSPPKLARGGIAIGEQLVTVGDNPSGREAIIPLEKLPDMLNGMMGGSQELFSYLRNGHIFLANNQAAVNYGRRWG